jgi:leucyl aminopeptidase
MKIVTHTGELAAANTDLIVLGVFADDPEKSSLVQRLDRALKKALVTAMREEDFHGKTKDRLVLATLGRIRAKRVALVGLGNRDDVNAGTWLELGATGPRLGNRVGAKHVTVAAPVCDGEPDDKAALLARGVFLGAYRYDQYKSDKGRAAAARTVALAPRGTAKAPVSTAAQIRRGVAIAEGVAAARDLVNEPAIELFPESFAKRATAMARESGLKAKVYGPRELEKKGMNLILGVGAGSAHPPRLVHLTYEPVGKARGKPVVLVGKGITFDSGGLCLKPPASMLDMKADMAGAAAVFGSMLAIAKLKPKQPVHGILSLAENMPSGTAIRLGDVISSAAGRTVEINNTDAEGRLVLADALHYACSLKPKQIIDLATLTGACVVALGPYTVGTWSGHDDLAEAILAAAARTGESFWRMPLDRALDEQLKSDVADTKNTGERAGGAITAALFLSEFVGDTPWAHLDIAGPATSSKDEGIFSKGGTGVGVATLARLLA